MEEFTECFGPSSGSESFGLNVVFYGYCHASKFQWFSGVVESKGLGEEGGVIGELNKAGMGVLVQLLEGMGDFSETRGVVDGNGTKTVGE